MRKHIIYSLYLLFLFKASFGQNQGINNWWLMGYQSFGGVPFGQTTFNFYGGSPIITYDSIEMDFNHTFADISDSSGNLLFYTNGYYIADATNDTMQNGSGINPGSYANFVPDGFLIPQGCLILPKPDSGNLFYLFHNTADGYPNNSISYHLSLTTIDMNMNGSLGSVVAKNQYIINDSLNVGKITACRHANGRDWWVICHRVNSNKFYKLLVTPLGISSINFQNIGVVRPDDAGQAVFSPDGTRYAYFYINGGLEVFDFDRCTGDLSNPVHINVPLNSGYNVGMAISSNSSVLYVSNCYNVLQFDLTSTNISASQQTVAVRVCGRGYNGMWWFVRNFNCCGNRNRLWLVHITRECICT